MSKTVLKETLLYSLLLTATWEGMLYITVKGFNFRPYEFFLVSLLLLLLLQRRIQLDGICFLLFLYAFAGVPSLLNSPSVKDTLLILFFGLMMVLVALSVRYSLTTRNKLERAVFAWVFGVANVVNAFGLVQFVSWALGSPISPMWKATWLFRPYSVFIEPNYYGNFLASQILILVVLWLSPQYRRIHRACLVSIPPALFLLAMNQSRGPWLGFLLAFFIFVTFRYVYHGGFPAKLFVGMLLTAGLVPVLLATAYIFQPGYALSFHRRILYTVDPLSEGAAVDRMTDMRSSYEETAKHPLIGSGVGTWGLVVGFQGREVRTAPRNIFLAWLFEKGLLGFLAGLLFVSGLAFRVLRGLQTKDTGMQALTWALLSAWLSIFFVFQFTFSEISPFYWVIIGLLLSVTDISLKQPVSG
jgi:O-antigen ligase